MPVLRTFYLNSIVKLSLKGFERKKMQFCRTKNCVLFVPSWVLFAEDWKFDYLFMENDASSLFSNFFWYCGNSNEQKMYDNRNCGDW